LPPNNQQEIIIKELAMNNNKKVKIDFKEYGNILVFALIAAVAAGIFTWQKQDEYEASLSLTISRLGTQLAQDYKYDNYYAVKATDEFGNTVAGWFKTPEMTQTIFKKADFQSGNQSLNSLKKRFQSAKISPNLVEVRFSAEDELTVKVLAQAIVSAVADKVNLLNTSSEQGISFIVLGSEPVIVKNSLDIWWNALAGFLVAFATGFFIKVSREYFSA